MELHVPKRTLKEVIIDASKQIAVSLAILFVGFLLLNWSAYSKILKHEFNERFGEAKASPMQDLVDEKEISTTILKTSADPEVQKKQKC